MRERTCPDQPGPELEDPRLSSHPDTGRDETVVMWSYPIIKDGLIYVRHIGFLEGNSNQGDALCFEPVWSAPDYCD